MKYKILKLLFLLILLIFLINVKKNKVLNCLFCCLDTLRIYEYNVCIIRIYAMSDAGLA